MGVKEVAGYYTHLKRGFDQLGVTSAFVPFDAHPFGYGQGARIPWLARLVRYARVSAKTNRKKKRKRQRAFWERVESLASFLFLLWVIPRFDVFIFGYRNSICRLKDLPLLRRMGKTIVFVFHGSDSRPPYLNGSFMAADRGATLEKCVRKTAEFKAELTEIERWADFIISHPPSDPASPGYPSGSLSSSIRPVGMESRRRATRRRVTARHPGRFASSTRPPTPKPRVRRGSGRRSRACANAATRSTSSRSSGSPTRWCSRSSPGVTS
jgi:hypothetical protein